MKEFLMKAQIDIREVVENDMSSMVELWKEMIDFHKERDAIFTRTATGHEKWAEYAAGNMSNEDSCVFVAECDDRIVGLCQVLIVKNPAVLKTKQYGTIQDIVVTANYRRCGIGEKLVKEALKWFRQCDIKRIEVRVSVYNELSTAFWRKIGFSSYLETLFCEI